MIKLMVFLILNMAYPLVAGELHFVTGAQKRIVKIDSKVLECGKLFLSSSSHQREFAVRTMILNIMASIQRLTVEKGVLEVELDDEYKSDVVLCMINNVNIRTKTMTLLHDTTAGLLVSYELMKVYNEIYPDKAWGGGVKLLDRPNPAPWLSPTRRIFTAYTESISGPLYRELVEAIDAKERTLLPLGEPFHRCDFCLTLVTSSPILGGKYFCNGSCQASWLGSKTKDHSASLIRI